MDYKKPEKLPKSALSLYVKLYCKRKGGTNTKYYNNLIEATKSWLSLSEEEKGQFVDKFKECQEKFKHKFADYLKNVEPYLKKKSLKGVCKPSEYKSNELFGTEIIVEEPIENENVESYSNEITNNLSGDNDNVIREMDFNESSWVECFMGNNQHQESITENKLTTDPLIEPIQPSIKSAEELFNIIKATDDRNEKTWKELSCNEKQRYRNVVLILKKDYIVKYKAYLECLPSKNLFHLYNKIMES